MELSNKKFINQFLSDDEIKDIIDDKIRSIITQEVNHEVRQLIRTSIDNIIESEVAGMTINILSGPVTIDNGWGNKQMYNSFDDMFKGELRSKITDRNIEMQVGKIMREKIDALTKDKMQVVADMLLKELNKEIK